MNSAALSSLKTRLWAAWPKKPAVVHYANGGVGDELMLTAIAREARRMGRPIHVLAAYPQLWRGNTDPASVQSGVERWWYAKRRGWIDADIQHLVYENGQPRHIAAQMAGVLRLELPPDWRPVLALDPLPRDPRLIVVQNSCRGARFRADTKEWPQDRWQKLAALLATTHRVMQVGTLADPLLPGVDDRRGKSDLMQAARLISSAALFLGLESGLQHVAAAVRTPAVIIYGGRTLPTQTGYPFNTNVTRTPPCAGCGLNEGCPNAMICMDIPVDEVAACVRDTLARYRP